MDIKNNQSHLKKHVIPCENGINKQQLRWNYGRNGRYNDVVSIFEEGLKDLAKIVGMVVAARRHGNDREEIADALYESTKHALNYFKSEEECMRKCEYEDFQSHKNEHMDFVKKTVKYCDETMGGNYDITDDYLDFLLQWVNYHVQGSDKRFVDTVSPLL